MAKSFKLSKAQVIEEVRAARDEEQSRYETDRDSYPQELESWKKEATKVLERTIREVDKGGAPWEKRYGSHIDLPRRPEKPKRVAYVGGFESTLRYLDKIASDTITVDQETYERWTNGRRA